jgi:hypothetical protein
MPLYAVMAEWFSRTLPQARGSTKAQ